jgi:NADPH-dependent glutamate synthase beta subunit-like oxidoreductase
VRFALYQDHFILGAINRVHENNPRIMGALEKKEPKASDHVQSFLLPAICPRFCPTAKVCSRRVLRMSCSVCAGTLPFAVLRFEHVLVA